MVRPYLSEHRQEDHTLPHSPHGCMVLIKPCCSPESPLAVPEPTHLGRGMAGHGPCVEEALTLFSSFCALRILVQRPEIRDSQGKFSLSTAFPFVPWFFSLCGTVNQILTRLWKLIITGLRNWGIITSDITYQWWDIFMKEINKWYDLVFYR